ncbi:hypothetical protein [Streptosporangium sp. NPDC002524]|uniref:hypothetical protein n=1 Tax=Streptosporangium sp. NPDC002524 TaxID=3154537 RepID=UPI003333CA06
MNPGETALFEWSASRSVQQWADLYKDSHRGDFSEIPDGWGSSINRPVGCFNIRLAGSASDAAMLISIDMDENVIWPNFNFSSNDEQPEGEEWFTRKSGHVHVYVKQEYARLPKNLDDLRRLLKPLNLWGKVED